MYRKTSISLMTMPEQIASLEDTTVKSELYDESFASEDSTNAQCVLFSDEKPYKCDQCDNVFESFSAFELHTQGHDEREVVHNFDTVVSEVDPLLTSYSSVKPDSPEQIEEKPHVCDKCDIIFDNLSAFELHVTEHEQDACTSRNTKFKSDSELQIHTEQIHAEISTCIKTEDNEKFRTCEFCTKSFTDVHSCTGTLKSITCSKCGRSFENKNSFQNHKCGKPYMCELCNKSFRLKSVLDCHICTQNTDGKLSKSKLCSQFLAQDTAFENLYSSTNGKPYTCNICNSAFSKEKTFHSHVCSDTVKIPYICQTCNKSSATKTDSQEHINNAHGNPLSCKIRTKFFTDRKTLHSRVCIDNVKKPYCNKDFGTKTIFPRHIENAHLNSLSDKICNKSSAIEHQPAYHVQLHHTGIKSHICKICSGSFQTKSEVEQHILFHEMYFTCSKCGKLFFSKYELKLHAFKAHNGKNPHTCHICDKPLGSKGSLIYHIRTQNGKKTYTCEVCDKSYVRHDKHFARISNLFK